MTTTPDNRTVLYEDEPLPDDPALLKAIIVEMIAYVGRQDDQHKRDRDWFENIILRSPRVRMQR